MTERHLVDEAVAAAIVEDYEAGKKLLDIERERGVPRSTVYWVLEKAGVTPSRAKRGRRLVGTVQTLAQLYTHIASLEERNAALEAEIAQLRNGDPSHRDAPNPSLD